MAGTNGSFLSGTLGLSRSLTVRIVLSKLFLMHGFKTPSDAWAVGLEPSPALIVWLRQVIAELARAKAKPVAMTELVSQSIRCRS